MADAWLQSAIDKFNSLSPSERELFVKRPGIVWPPTTTSELWQCQLALGLKTWGDFGEWKPTTPEEAKELLLAALVEDFGRSAFAEWTGEAYGKEFPTFEVTITSQDILDAWEKRGK